MLLAADRWRSDHKQLEQVVEEHAILTTNHVRRLKSLVRSNLTHLSSSPVISSLGEEEQEEQEEQEREEEAFELGPERLEIRKRESKMRRGRPPKVQGHVVN